MSDVDTLNTGPNAATAPRRGRLWLSLAMLACLAGGAAVAWYGVVGGADEEPRLPPPIYLDIDSNLIVNFQGGARMRYLQIGVQVMTRQPEFVDRLKAHLPVVRNNLIMLFSEQSYDELSTREGKAALREAALAEVQGILADRYGDPGVEAIYFTSFVMQ